MKLSRALATAFLVITLFAGYAITVESAGDTYEGFPVVLVKVNGRLVRSDVPAISFFGRTLVPVRFVSEALGASVRWDEATQTASVDLASAAALQRELDQANAQIAQLTQNASVSAMQSGNLEQQLNYTNTRVTQLVDQLAALKKYVPKQETLTYSNGQYFGYVLDGKEHGQGTMTFADGGKYVGEWKDGNMHGLGTYTFAEGNKHVGEYRDGKRHGQGTMTYPDGGKYVGEYRDDNKHGQGTLTLANGDNYVGGWQDGQRHGLGKMTFVDLATIVGEWKDGKQHGLAVTLFNDGRLTSRLYVNGVEVR